MGTGGHRWVQVGTGGYRWVQVDTSGYLTVCLDFMRPLMQHCRDAMKLSLALKHSQLLNHGMHLDSSMNVLDYYILCLLPGLRTLAHQLEATLWV